MQASEPTNFFRRGLNLRQIVCRLVNLLTFYYEIILMRNYYKIDENIIITHSMLIPSSQIKFNEGEKYAARNSMHRYFVY